MPLVFIHGVNTRKTDTDYSRAVAARRTMFDQLVAREVRQIYPRFQIAEDIYWGDLGVGFLWNLRSVPDIRKTETQGLEEDALKNADLLRIVSDETSDAKVEHLGPPQPLVEAAKRDPAGLVRAMFAEEADRFAPPSTRPPHKSAADKAAEAQGQHLGLLLIAVERFARQAAEQPALVQDANDDAVARKIQEGIRKQYKQVYEEARKEAETATDVEHLGVVTDGIGWALDHLKQTVSDAGAYVKKAATATARGASLGLAKWLRDPVSRKGLPFLGDVLVYLHHGRTASPSIYERVREGLLALKPKDGQKEPLVVVTHSFGSEILYDLLTSRGLDGLAIDLWVTVGAQTSLFAEMRLFGAMPSGIPKDTQNYSLGRPPGVIKWVNIYDPADALSYKHQPVFGEVTDIAVSDSANLTNAHGHYFVTVSFYETVLRELRSGMQQAIVRGSVEP